jgi:hypothetical protein
LLATTVSEIHRYSSLPPGLADLALERASGESLLVGVVD